MNAAFSAATCSDQTKRIFYNYNPISWKRFNFFFFFFFRFQAGCDDTSVLQERTVAAVMWRGGVWCLSPPARGWMLVHLSSWRLIAASPAPQKKQMHHVWSQHVQQRGKNHENQTPPPTTVQLHSRPGRGRGLESKQAVSTAIISRLFCYLSSSEVNRRRKKGSLTFEIIWH